MRFTFNDPQEGSVEVQVTSGPRSSWHQLDGDGEWSLTRLEGLLDALGEREVVQGPPLILADGVSLPPWEKGD